MTDVKIDLDAMNPIQADVAPQQVEEVDVVFVPFEDAELRVNQTTLKFRKNQGKKITRDHARILLEANKGYLKQ